VSNTYKILKQLLVALAFLIIIDVYVKVVRGAILSPPAIIYKHLITLPDHAPFMLRVILGGL
jgi:hypothetical protein